MIYHRDLFNFTKSLKKKHRKELWKKAMKHGAKLGGKIVDHHILKNKKHAKIIKKAVKSILDTTTSGAKAQTIKGVSKLVEAHFNGNKNKEFGNNNKRTSKGLDPRAKTMARLANDVYGNDGKRKGADGYEYLSHLSTYDHGVYHHKEKNEIVLSARGTNPKNMSDLKADVSILAGAYKQDSRFKNYNKLYKKVKSQYGDTKITATGHSLGASQSLYLGKKHDIENYSFNPGVSTLHNRQQKELEHEKAHVYHQSGDPISVGALNHDPKNGMIIGKPSLNPLKNHSMDNFLND